MFWLSVSVSVIVSLGVCALYVHLWRRRIRRDMETDAIIGKLRAEIGEIVTELNGTTERNVALIENRISELTNLVERAGKTTGVLRRESEKHDIASQVYTSLERSKPFNPSLNLDVVDDSQTGDPPAEAEAAVPEDIVDFSSLPIREKALFMHRNGESDESIAAKLGMSRGEVELIFSIHDRRPQ